MIKEVKLSQGQLIKVSQLKALQNQFENELQNILQRQQDIIDLIAEFEKIENIEKVDFKDGILIFTIKEYS